VVVVQTQSTIQKKRVTYGSNDHRGEIIRVLCEVPKVLCKSPHNIMKLNKQELLHDGVDARMIESSAVSLCN
jgi:glycerol-3-phosphate cytidylyltransferase-like family protein